MYLQLHTIFYLESSDFLLLLSLLSEVKKKILQSVTYIYC